MFRRVLNTPFIWLIEGLSPDFKRIKANLLTYILLKSSENPLFFFSLYFFLWLFSLSLSFSLSFSIFLFLPFFFPLSLCLNWIGALTLSLMVKLAFKKFRVLIPIKFLFFKGCLLSQKFTIQPGMKYFFYAWCVAPSCYLDMLDKLQKLLFWTFGTSPAASLKPSPHHDNVARLYVFCR